MKKFRNFLKHSAVALIVTVIGSLSGLIAPPAYAQSRAERETCAESVGIQTRQNGRNSWIKRHVSSRTYSAFLRCTDAVAMKQADAKPKYR